jgi:hypothetical protein
MKVSRPKLGHHPLTETIGNAESNEAAATLMAGA